MSAHLANLLSEETNSFKKFIDDIEFATGHQRNDLKISSNIRISTNRKIRSLGLNPEDTTAPELYHALSNLVKLHDRFIIKKFGINYKTPISIALDKIVNTFNEPTNRQSVFCIKSNVLRKILANNKPSKVTSLLGHRSFDSMLKNEDPKIVLSLAHCVESEEWRKNYHNQLKKLSASDFEYSKIEVAILDNAKFKKISKSILDINKHNVVSLENTGQILIIPLSSKLRVGHCILTYAYIINELKHLIQFSTFIQNHRFDSNFGETVAALLKNTNPISFYISKYNFSWDTIIGYISPSDTLSDDEKEDLLFQQELVDVSQLDAILTNIEPALHFWSDSENLGYINNGNLVSLNLLDVSYNCYNQLSLHESKHIFMEKAINRLLISKYLDSGVCANQVSQQMSVDSRNNDFIQIFKNKLVYS